MSFCHYSDLAARARRTYDPPSRLDLELWVPWAWSELGIFVQVTEQLPPPFLGEALLVERDNIRGCIALRPDLDYPLWVLCHEIGHLMTGHCYSIDCARDMCAWRVVPAEKAASEYGMCLLIDGDELVARLEAGQPLPQAAKDWQVPREIIRWRCRLLGLTLP